MRQGISKAQKRLIFCLILTSFALLYAALADLEIMKRGNAALVAALAALNPVSVYQTLSFYVDGQLVSLFICLAAAGIMLWSRKRSLASLTFFLIIPIFVNLKFTALLDALVVCALMIVLLRAKWNFAVMVRGFWIMVAALAVGVLIIGASPYITNGVRYENPFYPLEGPGSIDLKPENVPGNYINENSVEIFFLSFFAQSSGLRGAGTTSTYKIPFTYSTAELATFHYTDAEEGGFGPLFGGIVILVAGIFFAYYVAARKNKKEFIGEYGIREIGTAENKPAIEIPPPNSKYFHVAFWLMVFVIALSVIDPISSLARYVPQAYLIAVIPIALLFATRKKSWSIVAYIFAAILLFND